MTADDLLFLLANKHMGDVFISECKDGATHTRRHRRLDAWVLLKTWSPVTAIGYEIKVSRADWLNDNKVTDYLPMCHRLNVVAPKGVVQLEELPEGVGLLEPAGERLLTRRKAARREITLPEDLLIYILMCRTKVTREQRSDDEWRMSALRQWTVEKKEKQTLSYAVNEKIHKVFADQEERMAVLQQRILKLDAIRHRLIELGMDPDQRVDVWDVEQRAKRVAGVITPYSLSVVEQAERTLKAVREALAAIADFPKKTPH